MNNSQILIWGDYMKRQISICIFLAFLVIILAWVYIIVFNTAQRKERDLPTEENSQNIGNSEISVKIDNEYETNLYYALDDNGRVSIYYANTQALHLETGIETSTLPAELQEELSSGLFFKTEAELYDFLEGYSS